MVGTAYEKISLADRADFLGIGIWQQQYLSVLRKAAMICLECIGIS
ncbi:MAG: hypothetical protein LUC29_06805 [Acidaminococcaceae bacterium]|nr:hypothetical protein [Acidaminococcaceae bacterium]